jgi:hypothetical protein
MLDARRHVCGDDMELDSEPTVRVLSSRSLFGVAEQGKVFIGGHFHVGGDGVVENPHAEPIENLDHGVADINRSSAGLVR